MSCWADANWKGDEYVNEQPKKGVFSASQVYVPKATYLYFKIDLSLAYIGCDFVLFHIFLFFQNV